MAREFQIKVEAGKSVEETADWLAMSVSTILDELFPEVPGNRINRTVAEQEEGSVGPTVVE